MVILDNIIILTLIVGSFFLGKHISDTYNQKTEDQMQYMLRLSSAEKGVAYVAPPAAKKYVPIGQQFFDKLKENGKAVQQINRSHRS